MRKIKLNLTILFFILSYLGLNAQNAQNGISNLTITPSNPNSTSQVKAIANCVFGGMNCIFKGSTVAINNDTITVVAKHQVGFFMALCYATDTITIGQLSLGNYTLIFHLKEFNYNGTYDIDTLNFTVSAPTDLSSHIRTNHVSNIYPNPINDILNVDIDILSSNNSKLQILNNLGQIVREEKIKDAKSQINLSQLQRGIYTLKVFIENEYKTFKVIKN
ncbi:MAG: T9SS type A sorting domain-containing protein [Bacteroidetes bacterium]|nr:T9SS type A sorting domain-containing protein [Bacteroidota bacterium]